MTLLLVHLVRCRAHTLTLPKSILVLQAAPTLEPLKSSTYPLSCSTCERGSLDTFYSVDQSSQQLDLVSSPGKAPGSLVIPNGVSKSMDV